MQGGLPPWTLSDFRFWGTLCAYCLCQFVKMTDWVPFEEEEYGRYNEVGQFLGDGLSEAINASVQQSIRSDQSAHASSRRHALRSDVTSGGWSQSGPAGCGPHRGISGDAAACIGPEGSPQRPRVTLKVHNR
ncbi:hypothetical protein NDU88_000781 [Pleurodeles waltl]|uniref:Uncharacterized protein n=1 Tax=Pleurodeles waltl TaxID=8319 RepID=A0AAV7R8U7_PLEWA|nr:hypothetical protein NDU88_000781 [Pleurodeles waltl]